MKVHIILQAAALQEIATRGLLQQVLTLYQLLLLVAAVVAFITGLFAAVQAVALHGLTGYQ